MENKKVDLQIEELEERIAPIVHPLLGSLGVTLGNPSGSGGLVAGDVGIEGNVGASHLQAPIIDADPSNNNPSLQRPGA